MNLNVYEYAWPSLIRPVRHSASSPLSIYPFPYFPSLSPLHLSIYLTACASLIRPVRRTACTFPLCSCVSLPASLLHSSLCLSSSLALSLPLFFPPSLLLFIFVSFAVVGNSKSSVAAAVALPQQMATAALDQAAFFPSLLCPLLPFSEFLWPTKTIKSSELLMR